MKQTNCYKCKTSYDYDERIGFKDECSSCHSDLHCCLQCEFYDQGSYNDCKETSAERVVDKEKANYCEYFRAKLVNGESALDPAAEAKKKLEALFK